MTESLRCPPKALVIDTESAHGARFLAEVPAEHTMDAVRTPDYFGLLQAQARLRPGDYIAVRPIDYSWHIELMVRALEPGLNRVTTVELWSREFDIGELPAGWEIVFRGKEGGHAIIRDGEPIEAGFKTKESAAIRIAAITKTAVAPALASPDAAPKNKGGRPRKETPAPEPVTPAA